MKNESIFSLGGGRISLSFNTSQRAFFSRRHVCDWGELKIRTLNPTDLDLSYCTVGTSKDAAPLCVCPSTGRRSPQRMLYFKRYLDQP